MALVDMVCALAATTAVPRTPDWRGPAWCRPTLADAGPTVLSNSYDPLLGLYGLTAVPNDVLLSTGASLHVVTGPNRRGREREMGGGGWGWFLFWWLHHLPLSSKRLPFQPLSCQSRSSGKSTYLRTVGICVVLAQVGQ